jgi:hypothetical protein
MPGTEKYIVFSQLAAKGLIETKKLGVNNPWNVSPLIKMNVLRLFCRNNDGVQIINPWVI